MISLTIKLQMGYAPTVFEIHILVLLSVTVILTLPTKLIIQYLTHNISNVYLSDTNVTLREPE